MKHEPPGVAELLSHRRRRYVLYCLYTYSNPMTLADVAELITRWESDGHADDHLRDRLRVYNDLYHDHLPALCDADLVVYSQAEDMVDLGPAGRALEPTIESRYAAEIGDVSRAAIDTSSAEPPG